MYIEKNVNAFKQGKKNSEIIFPRPDSEEGTFIYSGQDILLQ